MRTPDLTAWEAHVDNITHPKRTITIGLAGKYTHLMDSYLSVIEALKHAGAASATEVKVHLLDTEAFEGADGEALFQEEIDRHHLAGIVVPGGFGTRGIEGKIMIANYCREHQLPYLGLCLGLQIAVIAFTRNVC